MPESSPRRIIRSAACEHRPGRAYWCAWRESDGHTLADGYAWYFDDAESAALTAAESFQARGVKVVRSHAGRDDRSKESLTRHAKRAAAERTKWAVDLLDPAARRVLYGKEAIRERVRDEGAKWTYYREGPGAGPWLLFPVVHEDGRHYHIAQHRYWPEHADADWLAEIAHLSPVFEATYKVGKDGLRDPGRDTIVIDHSDYFHIYSDPARADEVDAAIERRAREEEAERRRRTEEVWRRHQPPPTEDERTMAMDKLELTGRPTAEEIEASFRRYAQKYHPDKGGSAEKFRAGQLAREILLRTVTR
jgi:hypothetical protein